MGALPDTEEVINKITSYQGKYYVTIDMSDMFFAKPITGKSQEYSIFSCEGEQYQFVRLPQGYLNSPVIAHTILSTPMDQSLYKSLVVISYTDDIITTKKDKEQLRQEKEKLIQHLREQRWTINDEKISGPDTHCKFLGIQWFSEGRKVPDMVIDKIQAIGLPKDKREAQRFIGLFGYWRQHLSYLNIILKPTYKITRKAQDFEWTEQQQ